MNIKNKFSFKGGVHPSKNKKLARKKAIQPGPAVKQIAVMLSQHIGTPCQPLVKKDDIVQAGQKIGDCDAMISAAVHSPVNGKVKEIALRPHPAYGRNPAIIIEPQEQPAVEKIGSECQDIFKNDFNPDKFSSEQICGAVQEAGIVGMGGAGFPTRVKIEPNPRIPKNKMIINGCECEPCITCDYRIMLEWTHQIIAGIKLAQKAAGCPEVFIGIEDNKPKAIKAFKKLLQNTTGCNKITVVTLKTKYPQGGERQLIEALLNKNVPTGGIPPMMGVVVLNVATAAAIAQAVVTGRPLTHRVVTVTGKAIAKPGNYYVPIGTPVNELLDFCGPITKKGAKVILGGPMMGISLADLTTPITKTSGAVTVLTRKEVGIARHAIIQTPCIRCGRCLEVCPEHLNPTKIAHAVKNDMLELAQSYYISACIECGCCSYVCPANIELTGFIKTGKIYLAREQKARA